jgi:hypothetical protein
MLSEVSISLFLSEYSVNNDESGWDGLALVSGAPSDRPAFGATCYTNIYNVPISVSFYDNSAFKATSIYTATATNAQAFAYPYEGFALGVAVVQSTTGTRSASQATQTAAASTAASSSPTAAASSSHYLSGGAIAGIVIGVLAGVALILAAAYLILRHRRNKLNNENQAEQEYQYGGAPPNHDLNAPMAGYYNSDPKKFEQPPEELYGSQDVKNHGEPQELQSSEQVYEMGDGRETGRSMSERDKSLPALPSLDSPSPVSPEYR